MSPDYFQRLLAASHPALANCGRLPSPWAPHTTASRTNFTGQPIDTPAERREHQQRLADEAGSRAEEKFESYRTLRRVVNDAYGRAVSRRHLEQALEHLKRADGR
jgi:hypothetical protein